MMDESKLISEDFRSEEESEIWDQVLATIRNNASELTKLDGMQLQRYCRFLCRWRMIEDKLERLGNVNVAMLMDKDQQQLLRVLWSESRALDISLKQIENSFGMTPLSRLKLGSGVSANNDRGIDEGQVKTIQHNHTHTLDVINHENFEEHKQAFAKRLVARVTRLSEDS